MVTRLEDVFTPEVWKLMCNRLKRKDLASLCRVSSSILGIVRFFLYNEVQLIDTKHGATLSLLASNPDLVKRVQSFDISLFEVASSTSKTKRATKPTKETFLDIIESMTSLRKLSFGVLGFSDASEQRKFLDRLNGWNHSLQVFEFKYAIHPGDMFHGRPSPRLYPSPDLNLTRLTKVDWQSSVKRELPLYVIDTTA
jgi:hypothetical protein